MTGLLALVLHLGQWVLAFFTLDIFFRVIPVEPAGLREQVRLYQRRFTLLAVLFALVGGLAQAWWAGAWGKGFALLGWLPWWILWRFGWRKQFTFLYKDDGGEPRS